MKGMSMTVLARPDHRDRAGVSASGRPALVIGVLSSHDQDEADPLPHDLRVIEVPSEFVDCGYPLAALDVRRAAEDPEHPEVVAVPVKAVDGVWRRVPGRWTASGAYLVADDSRMRSFMLDVTGLSYAAPIPLHSNLEG